MTTIDGGAGETSVDTGVDWAAGEEFGLRVTISADSVAFSSTLAAGDATATFAAHATGPALNVDDGVNMICVLGWTQDDAGSGVALPAIDYVEIGVSQ